MDTYTVHLAMAALAGASLAAVSAYYVHLKALTQALDFAKSMGRDRDREVNNNSEGAVSTQILKKKKRRSRGRRSGIYDGYYRRGTCSVPEATVVKGGISEEKKGDGYVSRIHALPEGMANSDFSPGE